MNKLLDLFLIIVLTLIITLIVRTITNKFQYYKTEIDMWLPNLNSVLELIDTNQVVEEVKPFVDQIEIIEKRVTKWKLNDLEYQLEIQQYEDLLKEKEDLIRLISLSDLDLIANHLKYQETVDKIVVREFLNELIGHLTTINRIFINTIAEDAQRR